MKNRLAERRKELKLTQAFVAKSVGISESHYQKYEYGQMLPGVDIGLRIADVLKSTVEYLWGTNEEK